MELGFLREIVGIFLLSIVVVLISHKFKVPTILGLLLTGLLCGPSALGVVSNHHAVDIMAEVGVALLLFTIGMELSAKELIRMKRSLLVGGGGQVALTVAVITALCLLFLPFSQALVMGCLVTLSSTAIVLSLFQQKAQTESPQGRASLSILIFQDIVIVPMMLIFPLLKGDMEMSFSSTMINLGTDLSLIVGLFLFGKYLLPRLMLSVVRTRSRELMLMTTLGLCLAIALSTAAVGLSLSLGAFIAGLLLAESEYSLSVMENVLPFKEVFTSIFFISVGMLLNLNFFFENILMIVVFATVIVCLKIIIMIPVVLMAGLSLRTAIITALSLAQVGEFSFVLAGSALDLALLTDLQYQNFLAASIVTMALTPVFMSYGPKVATAVLSRGGKAPMPEQEEMGEKADGIKDHIIIIGFGIGGKNLAQVAKESQIPYVISEMNPDTVKRYRETEPIRHGDASYPLVLEHLHVKTARVLAIMVTDPVGARAIINNAKQINPNLHVIVRARFVAEVQGLMDAGANEVIPEEFETSIEVFARILNHYLVPKQDIDAHVAKIRQNNYTMLRNVNLGDSATISLRNSLPSLQFSSYVIEEGAILAGQTLGQGTLRAQFVNVAAINRNNEIMTKLTGETELLAGDILYILGSQENLYAAEELFHSKCE